MKKLFAIAIVAALTLPLVAQETSSNEMKSERRRESAVWPAFFAICEFPASPDVIGLRLTLPFSTAQDNVTGFDVGLWGSSTYFEGIQLNVLRCDVKDSMTGIQCSLLNTIGFGYLSGAQIGLWNQAVSMQGIQCGLVNIAGETEGFQVGLINRCETMHGFQIGLINVIRDAEIKFCPGINIGF